MRKSRVSVIELKTRSYSATVIAPAVVGAPLSAETEHLADDRFHDPDATDRAIEMATRESPARRPAGERSAMNEIVANEPLGLQFIGTAQRLASALDDALTAAGGSLRIWTVLVSAKIEPNSARHEISAALDSGTRSDDLEHMEAAGLIVHSPDPRDSPASGVELTAAGEALFRHLPRAVVAFDTRLRKHLTDEEVATLGSALVKLRGGLAAE